MAVLQEGKVTLGKRIKKRVLEEIKLDLREAQASKKIGWGRNGSES